MKLNSVTGYSVTYVTELGQEHTVPSLAEATKVLGFTNQATLRANANVDVPGGHWLKCRKLGLKIKLTIEGVPSQPSAYSQYTTVPNTVSLEGLTLGKVYVYSLDNQMLPYGPFDSVPQADKAVGAVQQQNHFKVNTMVPVKVSSDHQAVLYVKAEGPFTSQPMSIIDLVEGTVVSYASAKEAAVQVGYKRTQVLTALADHVYPCIPYDNRLLLAYDRQVDHHRNAFRFYWDLKARHLPNHHAALCRLEAKAVSDRLFGSGITPYVATAESVRASRYLHLVYRETGITQRKLASQRYAHVGPQSLPSYQLYPSGKAHYKE